MSTPADYAGRRYDISAFRGQKPSGDALLDQDVFAAGGQACAGVVKVVQWFVITLLKEQGSMPFDPESGSTFYTKLSQGRLRTPTEIMVAFGFAVGDIQAQANAIQTDDTPADERFTGATLGSVEVAGGVVRLGITVTTAAGASRAVLLPIPATPP